MFKINERPHVKLEGMELEFQSGNVETGILGPDGQSGVRYNIKFKLILDFDNFTNRVLESLPHFYEKPYESYFHPELGGLAYLVDEAPINLANNLKEKNDLHDFFIKSTNIDGAWDSDWAVSVGDNYLIKYEKPTFSPSPDGELYIEAAKNYVFFDKNKIFEISDLPVIPFDWTLYMRDEMEFDGVGGAISLSYLYDEIVDIDGSPVFKEQLYTSGKYLTPGPISSDQIKKA